MISANTALVVIDVQAGFLDPSWGERNNHGAEANIARLLSAWRREGRAVHHVRHASRSPKGTFYPGTPGYDFKPEAEPRAGEPIHVKQVNSGFIGTDLEAALRQARVDALVIVGLTTPHCVSTTTRMAGNLGFDTCVVEDATAAFARPGLDGAMRPAQQVHETALSDLADEFARIAFTNAVLNAMKV